MTKPEALRTLGRLRSAYPSLTLTDETVATYVDEFERLADADAAYETAGALIRTARFFPTVAEFREAYQAERRNRRMLGAARLPELPAAEVEQNLALRDELAEGIGRPFPDRMKELLQ